MKDSLADIAEIGARVPVTDIERSRQDFPGSRISFHLQLTCAGLFGLSDLCQALGDAGFGLKSLRVNDRGMVDCVLHDAASVDLRRFATRLGRVAILAHWTTQVDF